MKRHFPLGLLAVLLLVVMTIPLSVSAAPAVRETTVLFTHDLHSHFLPQADGGGHEVGGYARLKTAIDGVRADHPDALLVDGGDFSIGSLIQTLYTTQAAELRTMGAMGYDAVTVGNHEFDHTGQGFGAMLRAAADSGDRLPAMVIANYKPAPENPDQLGIQRAMASYGVQDCMILERGGVNYGIFGIMGIDSDAYAPSSGFIFGDPVLNARRCVNTLKEQGAEFIICLSHSGIHSDEKKSEDHKLAREVEGIDLIVSGHTHTLLAEPIQVENTYIVSAQSYGSYLGSITLSWNEAGEKSLVDYQLIPIDEGLEEDRTISALCESWKSQVSGTYLSRYNLTYDQVLTTTPFDLDTPASWVQEGNALGQLVADSFLWAVKNLTDEADELTVTVTADGVLRAPLWKGEITASEAFDVLSMGVGADGTSGFPLVAVWLTGKELKAAAEVDASVPPIMPGTQLYMAGMRYSFNTHRMFFNRVTEASLYELPMAQEEARHYVEIEDDRLYRVVTGMYVAQMLETVKEKSMGLLSLEPKLADGTPVTDFNDCILYDKNGSELKEWCALAAYLRQFGDTVPDWYSDPSMKEVSHSWNPIELLKNLNWITLVVLAILLLVVALAVVLVRKLFNPRRRRYGSGYRGSSRRRFGR